MSSFKHTWIVLSIIATASVVRAQRPVESAPPLRTTVDLRIGESHRWTPTRIDDLDVDRFGNMYVLDRRQQLIAKFGNDGKFVGYVGKKGQGPGEFERALRMQLLNDTLWVLEARERTSYFSVLNPQVGNSKVVTSGVNAKGLEGVLVDGFLKSSTVELSFGSMLELQSSDRTGRTTASIFKAHVEPRTFYYALNPVGGGEASRTQMLQPFWTWPLWNVARDGESVLSTTHRETKGAFDTITVTSLSLKGKILWRRQIDYPAAILTDRQFQSVVDSLTKPLPWLKERGLLPDKAMIKQKLQRPKHWPPVTWVAAGIDSTIWLRVHNVDLKIQKWLVLSKQGILESTIVLPAGVELLEASRRTIWGRSIGADDVPVIIRYKLSK